MLDTTVDTIDMAAMGQRARAAAQILAQKTTAEKHALLLAMADAIDAAAPAILEANRADLDDARANGLRDNLIDRMDLQKRLSGITADLRSITTLPDPVGTEFDVRTLDNGLRVRRRRTPIGVLGLIYEARPNVTVDIVGLSLATSNAVIMRGGKEILRSNMALVTVLREALRAHDFPVDAVQLIESTDRKYVNELLRLHQYVDMIIPRGGAKLHALCRENSTIPVITGGIGIVHLYVDATAKLDDALGIIHNAKTQRPSVCNALDTVLVNEAVAADFLPRVVEHLGKDGVTFKAEPRAFAITGADPRVAPAGDGDFDEEWLSLVLGLKVVDDLDAAIDHIRAHSTLHSDGILTQNMDDAARFLNEVDSAAVFVNASTRFNDGGALGLGAEVAVSTQKLHARGPMALQELTTYKWIVEGDGHVRS